MRCELCEKEGRTSQLNISPGSVREKDGKKETYWDENEVYHNHSNDIIRTSLWCSNGHRGTIVSGVPCPGCDFGRNEKIEWI